MRLQEYTYLGGWEWDLRRHFYHPPCSRYYQVASHGCEAELGCQTASYNGVSGKGRTQSVLVGSTIYHGMVCTLHSPSHPSLLSISSYLFSSQSLILLTHRTSSFVTDSSFHSEASAIGPESAFVSSTARPDVPLIIKTAVANSTDKLGVVVCGPQSMTVDARNVVSNILKEGNGNVGLFVENFGW